MNNFRGREEEKREEGLMVDFGRGGGQIAIALARTITTKRGKCYKHRGSVNEDKQGRDRNVKSSSMGEQE